MSPAASIVVGECSFASRRTSWWQADVPASPSRAAGRRVWGDGSEQQSKGAVSPLSEQREHTSSGSHPRSHYNVEQPTRNGISRIKHSHDFKDFFLFVKL